MIEIKRWTDGVVIHTVDVDNLTGANLTRANLAGADLTGANLTRANLADANLAYANLTRADLTGADLADANLARANLADANLADANLARANLADANLAYANISQATGLLNAGEWLASNFASDADGLIVYRAQVGSYDKPDEWKWEPGAVLTENAHPDRCADCACGVSFATPKWLMRNTNSAHPPYWRCRIRWIDLAGVVVPYNTDGKARCERLELIETVSADEMLKLAEE